MSALKCRQCGITPADVRTEHPEDYFVSTDNGWRCTTCVSLNARLDPGLPSANLTAIFVAANRVHRTTLARLRLAEDCASLFRDHLHGCVDTPRETEALTEWEYAAGVQPVPDTADDYPRAEDMA